MNDNETLINLNRVNLLELPLDVYIVRTNGHKYQTTVISIGSLDTQNCQCHWVSTINDYLFIEKVCNQTHGIAEVIIK